jgi:hypothetical protein
MLRSSKGPEKPCVVLNGGTGVPDVACFYPYCTSLDRKAWVVGNGLEAGEPLAQKPSREASKYLSELILLALARPGCD